VDLILEAWRLWGEDCVRHLYGDFAFAIWDERRQSLFCARDHFGVKPFYYALGRGSFVFSNTLACVRMHPSVSAGLNELATADFLLFGYKRDASATTFRDIQRLPPAHVLPMSGADAAPRRYWSLSPERRIRYRNSGDYVTHFQDLLRTAVGDRLRTDSAAVLMSGGMDSSSVAATAQDLMRRSGRPWQLTAFTAVNDHLSADRERYYSGLVAEALGLPIRYLDVSGYKPFQNWDDPAVRGSEPASSVFGAIACDLFRQVEAHSRVALSGDGGDQVLLPEFSYFFDLLRKGRLFRLSADIVRTISTVGRVPRFGFRTGVRHLLGKRPPAPQMPGWLQPELVRRLDLEARWRECIAPPIPGFGQRPEAFQRLADPSLCVLFEASDPGETLTQVEVRYPLFDARLADFLLAIPPVPWNFDKGILRLAMRGRLPDAVLRRPKTAYPGDALATYLSRPGSEWIEDLPAHPLVDGFVDCARIPRLVGQSPAVDPLAKIRPLTLSLWLHSLHANGILTFS
jgi:asparagine synthase (glutamine-hydrolysing)